MPPASQAWQVLTVPPIPRAIGRPVGAPAARIAKRALDLVGAALGLTVVGLPLLGLMALVRLTDGGPALFVQTRVGRGGRPFRMLKLRTMVPEAERLRPALDAANEVDGPAFKIRADPRVTALGAFLRRTSLDELPQLVNVLRGEMSLVGPRPALPGEVAAWGRRARRRLTVLPGMTGLWQISGRSALPHERWLALDLDYVDRWSFARDVSILLRTLPVVIKGTGAW